MPYARHWGGHPHEFGEGKSKIVGQLALALAANPAEYAGPGPGTLARLAELHPYPLVGVRSPVTKRFSSYRVPVAKSGAYPYLELGCTGSSVTGMILDVDVAHPTGTAARDFVRDRGLPEPSWIVWSRRTGHCHSVWALLAPVHRYPTARRAPLDLLARVERYYAATLTADPGYTGVLTRNPEPLNDLEPTDTLWGPVGGYYLKQLSAVIPQGWRMPLRKLPLDPPLTRGVKLFRGVLVWAGSQANAHRPVEPMVREMAAQCGAGVAETDIRAIAGKIEGYRAVWAADGWHRPDWLAAQASRGRKGGRASGASRRAATADRDERIRRMRSTGLSLRAIAAETGVDHETVRRALHRGVARSQHR